MSKKPDKTKIITPPESLPEPTPPSDWMDICRTFDKISDVDEMYYFLVELVDRLKICSSTDCKIFPELHHLNLMRMKFTKVKTMTDAEKRITDKIELKKFERDFMDYVVHTKATFAKIYTLKVTRDSLEIEIEKWHSRKIEMMKISNQNSIPTPTEFQTEIRDGIKQVESAEDALMEQVKAKMNLQAK